MPVPAGVLLVVAAAALMVWRAPVYLVEPSFWAEEGLLFFSSAWGRSWLDGLVQRPNVYLLFYTNVATTLAASLAWHGVIALESAPRVTAAAALLVQLLPVGLVAFGAAPLWGGPLRRAVVVAAMLFGALTGGIWLNTINSQTFFTLTSALVLLEPSRTERGRAIAYGALLALCGLSAPTTSFIAPLFAWKAWRHPNRTAVMQTAIVAACAVVQVLCYVNAPSAQSAPFARFAPTDVGLFAATAWKRVIVLPILGFDAASAFGPWIATQTAAGPVVPLATGIVLLAGLVVVVGVLAVGLPRGERVLLPGVLSLVTTFSILAALGDPIGLLMQTHGAQRYFYVPGVLFLLLLIANVRREHPPRAALCAALVAFGLWSGASRYPELVRWHPRWPRFADQVRAWEANQRRPLAIWPRPWTMPLSPRR